MGERTMETTGSVWFQDVTNNYKAVIVMGTYSKTGFWKKVESGRKDEYVGKIYKCNPVANLEASNKLIFGKNQEEYKDLKQIKDMVEPICDLKGSWLRNLVIDGKTYWDIEKDVPFRQIPRLDDQVLPSDWRYREDLIWLKYNYVKIAHQWKVRIEEQQRLDRKNRQKVQ